MNKTKPDYTKQLYCALYTAHDRLRISRILYNETRDARFKGYALGAKRDLAQAADKIGGGKGGGLG